MEYIVIEDGYIVFSGFDLAMAIITWTDSVSKHPGVQIDFLAHRHLLVRRRADGGWEEYSNHFGFLENQPGVKELIRN